MGPKLSSRFPDLKWAADADSFLARVMSEKTPILKQLMERRVGRLCMDRGIVTAIYAKQKRFFVIIVSTGPEDDEVILSLGHEIGHTFHLDPQNEQDNWRNRTKRKQARIEKFAEEFGTRWWLIHQGNPELLEIIKFFRRNDSSMLIPLQAAD